MKGSSRRGGGFGGGRRRGYARGGGRRPVLNSRDRFSSWSRSPSEALEQRASSPRRHSRSPSPARRPSPNAQRKSPGVPSSGRFDSPAAGRASPLARHPERLEDDGLAAKASAEAKKFGHEDRLAETRHRPPTALPPLPARGGHGGSSGISSGRRGSRESDEGRRCWKGSSPSASAAPSFSPGVRLVGLEPKTTVEEIVSWLRDGGVRVDPESIAILPQEPGDGKDAASLSSPPISPTTASDAQRGGGLCRAVVSLPSQRVAEDVQFNFHRKALNGLRVDVFVLRPGEGAASGGSGTPRGGQPPSLRRGRGAETPGPAGGRVRPSSLSRSRSSGRGARVGRGGGERSAAGPGSYEGGVGKGGLRRRSFSPRGGGFASRSLSRSPRMHRGGAGYGGRGVGDRSNASSFNRGSWRGPPPMSHYDSRNPPSNAVPNSRGQRRGGASPGGGPHYYGGRGSRGGGPPPPGSSYFPRRSSRSPYSPSRSLSAGGGSPSFRRGRRGGPPPAQQLSPSGRRARRPLRSPSPYAGRGGPSSRRGPEGSGGGAPLRRFSRGRPRTPSPRRSPRRRSPSGRRRFWVGSAAVCAVEFSASVHACLCLCGSVFWLQQERRRGSGSVSRSREVSRSRTPLDTRRSLSRGRSPAGPEAKPAVAGPLRREEASPKTAEHSDKTADASEAAAEKAPAETPSVGRRMGIAFAGAALFASRSLPLTRRRVLFFALFDCAGDWRRND